MTIAAEYEVKPDSACGAAGPDEIRPEDLRRVVSIHYYGRSGSLFLQSLLDGHPQVVMLPGTYLAGFYRFWEIFGQLPALKLLGAFIINYDVLFDARSPVPLIHVGPNVGTTLGFDSMGENQDRVLGVDRDEFVQSLLAHVIRACDNPNVDRLSRRFFLQAIHLAYAEALGRPILSKDVLIVLQTHNPYFDEVEPLYRDFGVDVKFLHCLREPIQALGSWYSHWWEACTSPDPRGAPFQLELAGTSIARGIDHAKPIFAQYAHHFPHDKRSRDIVAWAIGNTRGVRLEDLHQRPRATLEKVRAWLGIDWHDALLHSTFDGQPWRHRTTGGRRSRASSRPRSRRNTRTSSHRSTACGSSCCSRISAKPGIIPFLASCPGGRWLICRRSSGCCPCAWNRRFGARNPGADPAHWAVSSPPISSCASRFFPGGGPI